MREIGSEFEKRGFPEMGNNEFPEWLSFGEESRLTFSGRSATVAALQDILAGRAAGKALLPSYCCDSMVLPFIRKGYEIVFYDVYPAGAEKGIKVSFDGLMDADVLLLCRYFGYQSKYPSEELRLFQKNGGIIIEDITHSLFCTAPCFAYSDYFIASIRKWGPLVSGGLYCTNRETECGTWNNPPDTYVEKKKEAMLLKAEYMKGGTEEDKARFRKLFQECNDELESNYSKTAIDGVSQELLNRWDAEYVRKKRRHNSAILHEMLEKIHSIEFLFGLREGDCPLFVPILVADGKRDTLRQFLIRNGVYCPAHWPLVDVHTRISEKAKELYQCELSLVCDQRYGEEDMLREASLVRRFYGG